MIKKVRAKVVTGNTVRKCKVREVKTFGLHKLREGFLMDQSCRGNSEATIAYYKGNINRFLEYLDEHGIEANTSCVTKEQLKKYILYLKTMKKWRKNEFIESDKLLTTKSVQTYIRAIKVWFSWMEEEDYIDTDVAKEVKLPKAAKKVIEILTEEDILKVFKYLESKEQNHLRDMLIFSTLIECGVRLDEITKLKLSNVKLDQNILKVIGKGDKERIVSFGSNLQKMFFRYINKERPEPANNKMRLPQFVRHIKLAYSHFFIEYLQKSCNFISSF